VQISVRAAAVRAALERATRAIAEASQQHGRLRFSAPVPIGCTPERWALILRALDSADCWGSTDAAGRTQVWAEIREYS
jgi:hypothetical protein